MGFLSTTTGHGTAFSGLSEAPQRLRVPLVYGWQLILASCSRLPAQPAGTERLIAETSSAVVISSREHMSGRRYRAPRGGPHAFPVWRGNITKMDSFYYDKRFPLLVAQSHSRLAEPDEASAHHKLDSTAEEKR